MVLFRCKHQGYMVSQTGGWLIVCWRSILLNRIKDAIRGLQTVMPWAGAARSRQ